MLVNQSHDLSPLPRWNMLFQKNQLETFPTSYPDCQWDGESKIMKEQYYEIPWDNVICYPSYSPVLPHFPKVPARLMVEVTFNSPREWYEFIDRPRTEMDLSFVIY